MKELTLLASFVAPCARKASTRSTESLCDNYASALSPLGRSGFRNGAGVALRAEMTDAALGQEPAGVYEAVLPQTETLVGMGFILVLCVALYWVWENQVVPVSRTKLAISKSRGEVKEYLNELKATSPSIDSSVSSEAVPEMGELSLQAANSTVHGDDNSSLSASPAATDDRAFERWLFTDWLQDNKSKRKGGRQKEPALPILKDAKWNSGDNPVVVAAFLMLVGILFTTFTERLASFG